VRRIRPDDRIPNRRPTEKTGVLNVVPAALVQGPDCRVAANARAGRGYEDRQGDRRNA